MISIIMPAKNVSRYVREAISALIQASFSDWELIVIEDHSTDNTFDILREIEKRDSKIKVFKNRGRGKVIALNYGYNMSTGEIIKCIDADDILHESFFDYFRNADRYDALCHDCYITTEDMKIIGEYPMNKVFFNNDFKYCVKYLTSLPRWTWSFNRFVGDIIFPIPINLPFEDVWFSLIIKKYANRIKYVREKLYYYRQHDNQTYGGVFNFDKKTVVFRAQRMLNFIDVLENGNNEIAEWIGGNKDILKEIKEFYSLLSQDRVSLLQIISANIPLILKNKAFLYKKMNSVTPYILRLKWFLDKMGKVNDLCE